METRRSKLLSASPILMILCPVRGSLGKEVRITQSFGKNPRTYKQFGLKGHNGVDFAGEKPGDMPDIFSPYDALVWKVRKSNSGYGNHIVLLTDRAGDGLQREIVLAHFYSMDIQEGDRVYLGQKLGVMGTTGFSSGVHLHLGLRRRNADMVVQNYNNGYFGYVDFEKYLLFWN